MGRNETTSEEDSLPSVLAQLRTADGLFVTDLRQRIVWWSESAEKILGYTAEQAIGKFCYQLVAGGSFQGHPVCRRNCPVVVSARRGRPLADYDVATHTSSGQRVWTNTSVILLRQSAGAQPLILHLFRRVRRSARGSSPSLTPGPLSLLPARDSSAGAYTGETASARPLSRRELEVVRLLANGLTTAEIAEALSVSYFTARNHIVNIQRKLGTRNRLEILLCASRHGLV